MREHRPAGQPGAATVLLALALMLAGGGCSLISRYALGGWRISEKHFTQEQMGLLMSRTAVFLLRDEDAPRREEFERALRAAWTLTSLEVVTPDQASQFLDPSRYAHFTITSTEVITNTYSSLHFYLALEARPLGATDDSDDVGYCRIELSPSNP